jgi:hypothetical protein
VNAAETQVWEKIMEIARHAPSLAWEDNPDKRLELFKVECQRGFKLEAQGRKIDYERSRRPDADKSVEQCWTLWDLAESQWETLNTFFYQHKAEIKEWLRDNPSRMSIHLE